MNHFDPKTSTVTLLFFYRLLKYTHTHIIYSHGGGGGGFVLFFSLFRAVPMAYGSSQARS